MSRNPPKPDDIDQEQFDRLLHWLDPDRETGGDKYEWIRKRLIKVFVCRGSIIPEELADETINRVARKLAEVQKDYVGDSAHYFFGVANNIFRESLRRDKSRAVALPPPSAPDKEEELDYACLEKCMSKLSFAHRDLVISYYRNEKQAKIDNRRKLAQEWGLGINALRIRACRIRAALQTCIEDCRCESQAEME